MTDFATNVGAVKRLIMFKRELALLIMAGEKTQTRRTSERGFEVGELLYIKLGGYRTLRVDAAAIIRVTGVRHEPIGEISKADAKRELGKKGTPALFNEVFEGINRHKTFDKDSKWWVVDFELVETNPAWEEANNGN